MEILSDHGNNIHQLYEASMRGCVSSLNILMQNDPLILHKAPALTSFRETPLHISALLGHLDFTRTLLTHKPALAKELDSLKHTPLHVASASGHVKIVEELLLANDAVCLVADQDGRIPLHLAAMRGQIEVIKKLIRAKPESVFVQFHGDTVLHLCIKYNHLEALKILVAVSVHDVEFLNLKNHRGYTISHLSVTSKQLQTTRYLLSVPQIRVDLNYLMENGLATFVNAATNLQSNNSQQLRQTIQSTPTQPRAAAQSILSKLRESLQYKSDRFEKARGNLMVVASLIATMSFQVAVNPPGGFWQEDAKADDGCPSGHPTCRAGTAIQAYKNCEELRCSFPLEFYYYVHNQPKSATHYEFFIACSTLSFVASLSIILLLFSGLPLRNKISVGLLIIVMFISVFSLAATYIIAIEFVQDPDGSGFFGYVQLYFFRFWALFVAFVLVIHVLRFCWWLLKKVLRFLRWIVRNQPMLTAAGSQHRRRRLARRHRSSLPR